MSRRSHIPITSVDNWQTTLRRQYLRRDPDANPIGVEPTVSRQSRAATEEVEVKPDIEENPIKDGGDEEARLPLAESNGDETKKEPDGQDESEQQKEEAVEVETKPASEYDIAERTETNEGTSTLKDWSDLGFLEKLESIHTVMEWHFQNPMRFRQTMRSDDEDATWVCTPGRISSPFL